METLLLKQLHIQITNDQFAEWAIYLWAFELKYHPTLYIYASLILLIVFTVKCSERRVCAHLLSILTSILTSVFLVPFSLMFTGTSLHWVSVLSLQTTSPPSSCFLCLISSGWYLQVNNYLELCLRFSSFLRLPIGFIQKSPLHSAKYKWLLNLYLPSRSLFYYQSPCIQLLLEIFTCSPMKASIVLNLTLSISFPSTTPPCLLMFLYFLSCLMDTDLFLTKEAYSVTKEL